MGVKHIIYNYERNTEKHFAFVQGLQKRPNLSLIITANIEHNGTMLYMIAPSSFNNLAEQSGLPHCWLTKAECEQHNPYHRSDQRLLEALIKYKDEIAKPDYEGPNRSRNQIQ